MLWHRSRRWLFGVCPVPIMLYYLSFGLLLAGGFFLLTASGPFSDRVEQFTTRNVWCQ